MAIHLEDEDDNLTNGLLGILNHYGIGDPARRSAFASAIVGHALSKLRRRLNPHLPQVVYEEIMASAERRFCERLAELDPQHESASLDEISDLFAGIAYFVMHEKLRETKQEREHLQQYAKQRQGTDEVTAGGLAEEIVDCVLSRLTNPIDHTILGGKLLGLELAEIHAQLVEKHAFSHSIRVVSSRWKTIRGLAEQVCGELGLKTDQGS